MPARRSGQLEAWLRHALEEQGGRRRSINLPAGVTAIRAEPARLNVTDEPALVIWCRHHLVDALHVRVDAAGGEGVALEDWAPAAVFALRAV